MKNVFRVLALFTLFLTLSAFTSKSASSVEGNWIGEFTAIDQSIPFSVHFWRENDELKATINLSDKLSEELPLSWVVVEGQRIHFELVQECGTLVFDGVLKEGRISGDLICSNLRGQFQLAPQRLASL
jgi:hypothetical protein